MSIVATTVPKQYSAAKNPMKLALNVDEYYISAGTLQEVEVTDNTPLVGGTITFTIGTRTYEVNLVASPDPNSPEIRAYTNAPQLAEVVTQLQNIPGIGEFFDVAGVFGTPSVITFTQKVADTANQMTISGWTAATIVTTDAIDPTYNPNYKSIVKLYAQADESASRDFTPIATLGGIPNVDSDVVIDLRKAFGGVLQPDAPEDTETNGPTLCSRMFTFYWLSYQDRYGTTPEEYSPVMIGYDSNYNGALRGGMNWESWDADTVNDDYFTATTNKFFTNTGTRKVSTGQPEWLYFFNKSQAANLRLVITATFTDNTTDTFSAQSGSGLARGVYRYAVGYTQLDIAGNVTIPTGHKVKSYTVKVENTSGPADVSETMTFSVDHGAGTPRYIVFENQWSGFDTLRCIGEAVFGIEAEGLDAVGADDPDYAPNEGPIGQYHTQVRDTIVLATGFLTGPEMEWLRELAESDVVYLVEGTALAKYTLDRSSFSALYGRQLPIGGLQIALKKANWR